MLTMFRSVLFSLVLSISAFSSGFTQTATITNSRIEYPVLREDTASYMRYGVKIDLPHDWIKEKRTKELSDWVYEQKALTKKYLKRIKFKDRINGNIEYYGGFSRLRLNKQGAYYFRFGRDPGYPQFKAMFYRNELEAFDEVLFSYPSIPNSNGGRVSIQEYYLSNNNKYLAIACSKRGNENLDLHVTKMEDGKFLEDHIKDYGYSDMVGQENGFAWKGNGFYYTKIGNVENLAPIELESYDFRDIPEGESQRYIYYHKLGTEQHEDQLVFTNKRKPHVELNVFVSSDERFLVIIEWNPITEETSVYVDDFDDATDGALLVFRGLKGYIRFIDSIDNRLLLITDAQSDNLWLALVDPHRPNEMVPALDIDENGAIFKTAYVAGKHIITIYTIGDLQVMLVFDFYGNLQYRVGVEDGKSFTKFMGKKGDPELFIYIESKIQGSICGVFDLDQNKFIYKFGSKHNRFDPDDYVHERLVFMSSDSVEIPVSTIRHKTRFNSNGDNPMMLNVYGGYGLTVEPWFDPTIIYLLENGGVYAQAHVRGGGDLGPLWHKKGKGVNKVNTVNDLIETAEFLIENNYTNPEKLAITGQSHGGFVVGSAIVRRPDLFRVAIPRAGLYDLLMRETLKPEYGEGLDSTNFMLRMELSPYHNVRSTDYPSTLIITALNDQRVRATQSMKMISRLQKKNTSENPILFYPFGSGHYQAYSWKTWLELRTTMLAFMFHEMGIKPRL